MSIKAQLFCSVELKDNEIIVEGEHHEQNQGESVHRQFCRRVLIPGIQKESIKCKLHAGRFNNSLGYKPMAIIHKRKRREASGQSNSMCRRAGVGCPLGKHSLSVGRSLSAKNVQQQRKLATPAGGNCHVTFNQSENIFEAESFAL
uniref:SHSP domain-containing protein n=1 Tax=Globodera rostochiensis TaxID=31243 RepID=A0A914GSY5_GLORO